MTHIRTIKPAFFRHEAIFDAEKETQLPLRLTFIGLLICSDREGRFRWRARQLKLDVLPYDDDVAFDAILNALAKIGLIVRYRVNDEEYGYIPTWHRHQRINPRETQSVLPTPVQMTQMENTQATKLAFGAQKIENEETNSRSSVVDLEKSTAITDHYFLEREREREAAHPVESPHLTKSNHSSSSVELPVPAFKNDKKTLCKTAPSVSQLLHTDNVITQTPTVKTCSRHVSSGCDASHTIKKSGIKNTDMPVILKASHTTYPQSYALAMDEHHRLDLAAGGDRSNTVPSTPSWMISPHKTAPPSASPRMDQSRQVFEHWCHVMQHSRAQLDHKRRRLIQHALKVGYTVKQLCQAIEGCALTPYNMGDNERGQRYDGLHVILRDGDQIDRFIRHHTHPPCRVSPGKQRTHTNLQNLSRWVQQKITETSEVHDGSI